MFLNLFETADFERFTLVTSSTSSYAFCKHLKRGVYTVSTKEPNSWVGLTQAIITKTPAPPHGQLFLRDHLLRGFGVRITCQGTRAYILEKRIDRRVKRITLGHVGELTLPQARQKAQQTLGKIAMGNNPVADTHRARLQAITLDECFQDFLKARNQLKPRTIYDYTLYLRTALGKWRRWPMNRITKDNVQAYHRELGETRGPYYANSVMRFLRALFNFALAQYEDGFGEPVLKDNPVLRLTRIRGWYREQRKQTVIRAHQLPAWFKAVEALREPSLLPSGDIVADYLFVLLFTGLRRKETTELRWVDIDLKDQTLTIPDPKNREPFTFPFSDYIAELLKRRASESVSPWVFPGSGKRGHLVEMKRLKQRVIEASGVHFTCHDLRRTFATVAESLDISPYAIKRLLNHKMRGDVTAGYIISDIERLRAPVQRITEYLLKIVGNRKTPVIELPGQAANRSIAA